MGQDIDYWRKWKKEHPEFPLSVGSNGQWRKMVRGRYRYFAPLDNPDLALAVWAGEKPYLTRGEEPPVSAGLTVGELCDRFEESVEARDLADGYARDLRFATRFIREQFIEGRPVAEVTPARFGRLRRTITESGRRPRGQKNLINHVRSVFLWGAEMGLYDPVRFGPDFKPPTIEVIEREREMSGRVRFIDREDLLRLIDNAKPAMKCMVLLGVNCGFYAQDSIRLTFSRLHLDAPIPHHDFPRVKTGRRRLAILWPETRKAIREYLRDHRGDHLSDCVILNQYKRPYTDRAPGRGIRKAFSNLLETAGVTVSPGTSIGSLRHTYATVCDLSADQQAIDLSLGHAPRGLQKRVYSQLNIGELERLRKLAKIVRKWLFKGKMP